MEFSYENNFTGINGERLFIKHSCGHLLLLVITMIEAFGIRKEKFEG